MADLEITLLSPRELFFLGKKAGSMNVVLQSADGRCVVKDIIVTVDQSGSMLDSAIFSAVMTSIFAELPAVRTSLILFDTNVVDLSDQVGQPVDVLLSIPSLFLLIIAVSELGRQDPAGLLRHGGRCGPRPCQGQQCARTQHHDRNDSLHTSRFRTQRATP